MSTMTQPEGLRLDELEKLPLKELIAYVRRIGIGLRGARTKRDIIRRLETEAAVRRMLSGLRDGARP